MPQSLLALSLKQPWAALVVHGVKTMEIRRWPTRHRGPVVIHASRQVDPRPEAWEAVTAAVRPTAELRGGLIGGVVLRDCRAYRDQASFAADCGRHLNRPEWFEPPALYGFDLVQPRAFFFRRFPGWFKLFAVELTDAEWAILQAPGERMG
jgi:hypothetical protein